MTGPLGGGAEAARRSSPGDEYERPLSGKEKGKAHALPARCLDPGDCESHRDVHVGASKSNRATQIHPSGIELVGPVTVPPPLPENLAWAFSEARLLAEQNPDAFGYPWADPATRELVLSPRSSAGDQLIAGWAGRSAAAKTVTRRTGSVDRSWGQLEAMKHDATFLAQAGLPDAGLIYMSEPDFRDNRVIITVESLTDRLMSALATRYGTKAIAFRVEPNRPRTAPQVGTRDGDWSPFYGGARINVPVGGCSTGFSWTSGGNSMMLSAGHCAPNGGSVNTPVDSMGSVTSSTRENWSAGVGTVYFSGQLTYRGDLSLIEFNTGKLSDAYMYRGGSTSYNYAPVREMWYRSPVNGDLYCVGGAIGGEICNFAVTGTGIDIQYWWTWEWARNVTRGERDSVCTQPGDSGGPVYTQRPDGGIAAKGINSGGGFIGNHCWNYFTDIWLAYYGLPGVLKTR